jgi:glycosyltransferase involved in cell wall biosynthesis
MRILLVTDAWQPQVNGVVRTIQETRAELQRRGHVVEVIGPDRFRTIALPTYRDIRLALPPRRKLAALIEDFAPDYIHIATEGPLGWAARRWCLRNGRAFTTAYHSRFPEYLAARLPIPLAISYAVLRRFHQPAVKTMVPTQSIANDLAQRGFSNIALWTRGVDTDLFRPLAGAFGDLPKPILLYAGRVATEKNLAAFLGLNNEGSKIVVGDGPQREELKRAYPDTHFTGTLAGDDLVGAYCAADVFVFPSRTDTFGLVLIEALACGTPIAAYDVPGPRDVLAPQSGDSPVGILGDDLGTAIERCLALQVSREKCRDFALNHYSWARATDQFLDIHAGICDHSPR